MSTASLPKSVDLDVDIESPFSPALTGLVEAAGLALRRLDYELSDDELLAISSAAFCNYVFDPKDNQHEDPARAFSRHGGYFSNYGPWESIGYYTGAEMRELTDIKGVDLAKLVAFELAHDRVIVTLDSDLQPRLVTSYAVSIEQRVAVLDDGTRLDLASDALDWQGDHEIFRNWMLLVRPGTRADWAAPSTRQRVDVLRWAAQHARTSKEFFQETRENYAPGLTGLKVFADFLRTVTDPDGAAYAQDYLTSLGRARRAAAWAGRQWADEVAEYLAVDAVAPQLREAADGWTRVADAIEQADTLQGAIDDVVAGEEAAVAALHRASPHFPSAFEG